MCTGSVEVDVCVLGVSRGCVHWGVEGMCALGVLRSMCVLGCRGDVCSGGVQVDVGGLRGCGSVEGGVCAGC